MVLNKKISYNCWIIQSINKIVCKISTRKTFITEFWTSAEKGDDNAVLKYLRFLLIDFFNESQKADDRISGLRLFLINSGLEFILFSAYRAVKLVWYFFCLRKPWSNYRINCFSRFLDLILFLLGILPWYFPPLPN